MARGKIIQTLQNMKRLFRNHAIFSWNWNSPSIRSRHVMWSWCRSSKTVKTPAAERHCTGLLHWRHNERNSVSTLQRLHKNIERHTAHTIVSWPYPKQWVIVHTSDFMMITRQSVYILSIITGEMSKLKTHSPIYWIMGNVCSTVCSGANQRKLQSSV